MSSRARYWLMEAIAQGYTTEALASDFAIIALTREGYRDDDAMSAVARAWHDLTPTQAN